MVEPKIGGLLDIEIDQEGVIGSETLQPVLAFQDSFGKFPVGSVTLEKLIDLAGDLVLGKIGLGQGRDSLGKAHQRLPGAGFKSKVGWIGVTPLVALGGLLDGNTPVLQTALDRVQVERIRIFRWGK